MDKSNFEHRAVIKFLTKKGNGPKQIHEEMTEVYGQDGPSYYQVKYWSKQFKWGRVSLEDDPRPGRPIEATTPEICHKLEEMILNDRRIKVSTLSRDLNIGEATVCRIIHDHLMMSKVCARWVPRMLTPFQKQARQEISASNLEIFRKNPQEFVASLVTGDETWVHHWDPETKQESMQWKHKGSPTPKKFKTQASAGKIMATIFWDSEGVLLVDFLEHKKTITGDVYGKTLTKLKEEIEKKRPGKMTRGVRLLHDNAPVHTARSVQAVINDCGYEIVQHPPYSPDLAPSDYFLFRHMKKHLRGVRFTTDEDLKEAVTQWLEDQDKEFFSEGISSLNYKWDKCIGVKGDYIEK